MSNWVAKNEMILAAFIVLFVIFSAFLLGGCASHTNEVVKYQIQEVKMPIKCEIAKPKKPVFGENIVKNVAELAEYAKKLEAALKVCAK